jgi:hypothetical protein
MKGVGFCQSQKQLKVERPRHGREIAGHHW